MSFDTFLPNENNKRLLPGFIAFCVAVAGVSLGFVASSYELKYLGIISLILTITGIIGGIAFIIYNFTMALIRFVKYL